MTRKATTFRLDPDIQDALAVLSEVRGRSQNQLVNEAVREFVGRSIPALEADLESTLARLRRHRLDDPTGERSLEAAMRAEAAMEHDPGEGDGVPGELAIGPATAGILDRLSG